MGKPPLRLAILMVNGKFNYKDHLWIELSVEAILRHTSPLTDFRIFLWNHDDQNPRVLHYLDSKRDQVEVLSERNVKVDRWTGMRCDVSPERSDYFAGGVHSHRGALQMLYEYATANYAVENVFTFDTDSWPIRDNWDLPLLHSLNHGIKLVGIWRDELQAVIRPYVHPSCLGVKSAVIERLALRFDVEPIPRLEDTLSHFTRAISQEYGDGAILALRRSNRKEYHSVFNGIYSDLIYHHHLGTRYQAGAERQLKSYGWENRGESLDHNKFVLDATTEMVFEQTQLFLDELSYGVKAIDFRIYRAYLNNNYSEDVLRLLFRKAKEAVLKDPLEAYYITGLVAKRLLDDSEFLSFNADLCEKLGHHSEAESYRSLVPPGKANPVVRLHTNRERPWDMPTFDTETENLGLGLSPGDPHYRAYVGPAQEYDLIAAMSFNLLTTVGLREHHRLLDIGCGSLRIGRLLIPYLRPGGYVGIEPNDWLVREGIARETGGEQIRLKKPLFFFAGDSSILPADMKFDFAIAQSVFSHGTLDLIGGWLAGIHRHLKPTGVLLATFKEGGTDFSHPKGIYPEDFAAPGWAYPKCISYRVGTIEQLATRHGFRFRVLDWLHPRQTWALFAREGFSPWWSEADPLTWNAYLASHSKSGK